MPPLKGPATWGNFALQIGGPEDGWETREAEGNATKLRQVEVLQGQGIRKFAVERVMVAPYLEVEMADGISRKEAAQWWLRCISCSETSVTLTNRDAGFSEPLYEQSLHLFSGGFMHEGHACGHLWGATLSAGIRIAGKLGETDARKRATLEAARRLVKALPEDGWSLTCRENTGVNFTSLGGKLKYIRSDKPKACGRKALAWAAQANKVIDTVLADDDLGRQASPCANCAVNCMAKVSTVSGLADDDAPIVAGFAGGLGLSGNVCGALSAGVFALSLWHYRNRHPKRRDSQMRAAIQELNLMNAGLRKLPSRLVRDFKVRFGSDLCADLIGRKFRDADDHSRYVASGGCQDVVQFVAEWLLARYDAAERRTAISARHATSSKTDAEPTSSSSC